MNEIFIPGMYVLSGICLFTSLHHGLIAARYSGERVHLIFAVLGLVLAFYIIAKAGAYQAETAATLIYMRHWEGSFAFIFLGTLPWFLAEYTEVRVRPLLIVISILYVAVFIANLSLPYTIAYPEIPEIKYFTLPWGEQVTDLRIINRNGWYHVAWTGIFVIFGYGFYSSLLLYKRGAHRKSRILALALGLFFAALLVNSLANAGLVDFVHTAEFGFLALIVVMSIEIIRNLQINEWRMRVLLDNVPAVIYTKDPRGRYLFVNRCYEELLHVTNETVVGKTDWDLFPAGQAELLRANDKQALESSRALQFEEVVDVDSVPHDYITVKFPVLDSDGVPVAVCGISTDVTMMRKAGEELNLLRRRIWHADRVLRASVMTASLAHELSQPLAAILCNAQAGLRFLNRDTPDLREIREILDDIARDDKRAAAIIKGLRAMLRQQETNRERIDLGDCIGELLDMMHTEFIEHRTDCESVLDPDCTILADKVQIQQVILNLLVNAMEAMATRPESDRRICVSVRRFGDSEIRVAIRDSGIGIPEDQLGRIFDGYNTTKEKGLGIGLAMCRAIVDSHSGRIWVECNDDAGVTLFLALPPVPEEISVNPPSS